MPPSFALQIDYRHEKAGWIECFLTLAGVRRPILASDVFPPFPDLLSLALTVAIQRLPFKFFWDEEGKGAQFEATPLGEDSPLFHLKVTYVTNDETWIDADLDRRQVAGALLGALRDFALHARRPSRFPWGISLAEIERVQALLEHPAPRRSQVECATPVGFTLRRSTGASIPVTWMSIAVWGMELHAMHLADTHPFWPEWLAFLEAVLRGDLPALLVYLDRNYQKTMQELAELEDIPPEQVNCTPALVWEAQPLDHPRHFRLQVTRTDCWDATYLYLDEVMDRRQFVQAWFAEFERMLAQDYQVFPDEDGVAFDLRSLPLGQLRAGLGWTR